ncbi:MAG: GNAT family N-acetyltransferase [Candidatus Micrarchaeota archaeon]|nr:GNAT family N-acetyltransferase [Candidatus Micrarchaeota archaeon]
MNARTTRVRPFAERDLAELIKIYRAAFAEPPWDEFKKCSGCGAPYSREEAGEPLQSCAYCDRELSLTDFWSAREIAGEIDHARSQRGGIVIVADVNGALAGFTYGYGIKLESFPFLGGVMNGNAAYMDDIAVGPDKREMGVGTELGARFLELMGEQGFGQVVVRTDERNGASMALFEAALGFSKTGVYDPKFPSRLYLKKDLR